MPSKALQISAVLFATFTVIDVHIGAMRRWTPNAIVIPDNAHRTERVAADELAHYIALATNVNVHIVTESQAGNARKAIWLGRTKCAQLPREFERLPHEVMRDAFVIKRVGNDVALYGGSPRGTLFAVYRYLERAFGWRWLQPDAGGESLTDEYDPQFPRYRMIEIPHFAIRGLVRPWAGVQRWYAKLGLNYALIPVKWGNLSGKRLEWILDASLSVELGEHCFSVYSPKGKMLCPHDISTLEHALRKLNELVRANPMVETFGIWPEDGIFVFCQCEQCGKFHPLETLDERYLRIINWLAEKALGHHPKIRIGFLAYNQYRQPPRGAKVFAKNTVLAYAAPIGFASITDRKRYQRFVHGLRKWLKCGVKRIWVYEYFNCSDDIVRMSALFPHVIGREIRMLLRTGASGLMSQIDNPPSKNWGTSLNYYVMARLLWNPKHNVDDLIAEYCRAAYGDASDAMVHFTNAYEHACIAMMRMKAHPQRMSRRDVDNVQRWLNECERYLTEAHTKCNRDKGRMWIERWRIIVRVARLMCDALSNWVIGAHALRDGNAKLAHDAYERVAVICQRICEIGEKYGGVKAFAFVSGLRIAKQAQLLADGIVSVGLEVYAPRSRMKLIPVRMNDARGADQLVLYTPTHGERTGTNRWGVEIIVRDERVVKIENGIGNAVIPRDGFVLSAHGMARWQLWRLKVGDRIILRRIQGHVPVELSEVQ